MSIGGWVLVAAVGAALALGSWRAYFDGRFRGVRSARAADAPVAVASVLADLLAAGIDDQPGERATLLQFSSSFCAPCRATRQVLADVATHVPGVRHLEVDAEAHLELVRRLGVLRTPTTLVLDRHGVEVARAGGAPHRDQVLSAIAGIG